MGDFTNFSQVNIEDHDGGSYGLKLGGTLVTATAAELNKMDGVTATAAELNYTDVTTLGTGQASKALTLDANGSFSMPTGGSITLDPSCLNFGSGSPITKTAAQINSLVKGVTSGWTVNGGSAVLDGSNPTTVMHGLSSVVAFNLNLSGSSAPGASTSVLTGLVSGGSLNVYAWKPTTGGSTAGDPTLIASSGTETFNWFAIGT